MASSAEQVFMAAVAAAESIRQQSKAAAFTTYAYSPAGLSTYKIAIADADVAYVMAVNSAANTADLQLGTLGLNGPIQSSNWAPLLSIA